MLSRIQRRITTKIQLVNSAVHHHRVLHHQNIKRHLTFNINYNHHHNNNHCFHHQSTIKKNFIIINFNYQNYHKRLFCSEAASPAPAASGSGRVVSFNLSDIGEGISEVVVKEWFVKVGDRVQQFDNICEVQSDKASVTITSRYDGIIQKLYYKVDDTAKVGLPLVDILVDPEQDSDSTDSEPVKTPDPENIAAAALNETQQRSQIDSHDYLGGGKILTTPAVRRMAIEYKVDLKLVTGTGRDGRILKEDVINYINNQKTDTQPQQQPQPAAQPTATAKSEPDPKPIPAPIKKPALLVQDRTEPMSSVTKGMFKTMTKSLSIPHFGLSEEIDITQLVLLRPEMKKVAAEKNVQISYMPFFIKAASLALNEYPILNATIDPTGEKIIYRASHNIGIAMDTKQGLLVPNIKNVNQMSILEIAQELNRLQELGQRGQLGLQDLQGGTFSLSNIGSIGGIFGIPVLVPGEVAIGAIGRVQQLPRYVSNDSDEIRRAHIMQVLWSADHRIIDGATMTRFCKLWKDLLENPFRIFMQL